MFFGDDVEISLPVWPFSRMPTYSVTPSAAGSRIFSASFSMTTTPAPWVGPKRRWAITSS
jgi:hypothetical protein